MMRGSFRFEVIPIMCNESTSAAQHTAASLALALGVAMASAVLGCGGGADVEEARTLQLAGNYADSIPILREVIEDDPANARANLLLGTALVATGDPSLAIFPLEQAAQDAETGADADTLLATIYTRGRNFEAAVEAATRGLERQPDRAGLRFTRGDAYLNVGDAEAALADAETLLDADPKSYSATLLKAAALVDLERNDEAGEWFARLRALSSEATADEVAVRGCLSVATFEHRVLQEPERAAKSFNECLNRYPESRFALDLVSEFYEDIGRHDTAIAIWQRASEASPENPMLRFELATRLLRQHRIGDAIAVLRELAERTQNHEAWRRLAEAQRLAQRFEEASASLQQALRTAPGEALEALRFARGDVLMDHGDLEAAERQIEELETPLFKAVLTGRLRLEQGDAEGASRVLQAALQRWPNNAGARFLAGRAALAAGDVDQAISQWREAVRADKEGTQAALELARLLFELGLYPDASMFAAMHVENRPVAGPAAHVISTRVALALDDYANARQTLEYLKQIPGTELDYAIELAGIERAQHGADAAAKSLLESGVDLAAPENRRALRAVSDHLSAAGRTDEALARISSALEAEPEDAELHELRGRLLANLGRGAEAAQAFERALALDAENVGAIEGLAFLARQAGDGARSRELFERAAALEPDRGAYGYAVAQLDLAAGDVEGAMRRLGEVLARDPGTSGAANDLAWLLAERGEQLERAEALALRAVRLEPSGHTWDTLGWVQLKRGKHEAAAASFARAVKAMPDAPSFRYHLGLALAESGQEEEAREALRTALAGGSFPEAPAARARLERLGAASN